MKEGAKLKFLDYNSKVVIMGLRLLGGAVAEKSRFQDYVGPTTLIDD